jgi:HD superfamily phosphodiesterase
LVTEPGKEDRGAVLTYEKARKFLETFHVEKGHDWDRHCICVGEIAYSLAKALEPFETIEPEQVRLMGLVHDFGRSVTNCPFRHSYEGHKLLKSIGEEELARICTCHSNGTYKNEDLDEYGLKPEDFYVRTLEEKLIFLADNLENHGEVVRQDVRISDVKSRYKTINPEFMAVLQLKANEFSQFDQEVRNLCGQGVYEILGI